MGQSNPPNPLRKPKPAQVLKPFGEIGIPALAAAAQFNRRVRDAATARESGRDIPWMLRKDRLFD